MDSQAFVVTRKEYVEELGVRMDRLDTNRRNQVYDAFEGYQALRTTPQEISAWDMSDRVMNLIRSVANLALEFTPEGTPRGRALVAYMQDRGRMYDKVYIDEVVLPANAVLKSSCSGRFRIVHQRSCWYWL